MSYFWIGALYGAIVGLAIALALIFIVRSDDDGFGDMP